MFSLFPFPCMARGVGRLPRRRHLSTICRFRLAERPVDMPSPMHGAYMRRPIYRPARSAILPRWYPLFYFRAAVYLRCFRAGCLPSVFCCLGAVGRSIWRYFYRHYPHRSSSVAPIANRHSPHPAGLALAANPANLFSQKNHFPSCIYAKKVLLLQRILKYNTILTNTFLT